MILIHSGWIITLQGPEHRGDSKGAHDLHLNDWFRVENLKSCLYSLGLQEQTGVSPWWQEHRGHDTRGQDTGHWGTRTKLWVKGPRLLMSLCPSYGLAHREAQVTRLHPSPAALSYWPKVWEHLTHRGALYHSQTLPKPPPGQTFPLLVFMQFCLLPELMFGIHPCQTSFWLETAAALMC